MGMAIEGSGWDILYMHIETRDRAQPGTRLHAGDHIGHPSCEGGEATGIHVHMARQIQRGMDICTCPVPYNLSGWISAGTGEQYVGTLTRNGVVLQNLDGSSPANQIQR